MDRTNRRPAGAALCILVFGLTTAGTAGAQPAVPQPVAPRDAEALTVEAQRRFADPLPWRDRQDFEDVRRGFVASLPDAEIRNAKGDVVWTMKDYAFIQGEAPPTVNPSLWRQAQLNAAHGLFKVIDGVYQVRNFDISNMTIIEGRTGLIVIDPLVTVETARAGLELYFQHRPRRPVLAVIYTHSHADHWGGVRGVVDEAEFRAGRVHIIAPLGFMEHAVSENVIAGNAMSRRAQYQFGTWLPRGPRGQVDTGLGKTLAVNGTLSLLPPTMVVEKPIQDVDVDGVIMQFQQTPGTEAPSEMNIWFRELKLLNMAENVTHNMHNLYTIRGAEVRDGNLWARYIQQSLDRYGNEAEVMIAQHHWPTWGNGAVRTRLARHRDLYKFMHDQSARLLNQGYGPLEIAERLTLPKGLASEWSARGYYGTLSHNAKAVYQKYLGWYDANPANLNPLPPVAAARKSVEYMGGAAAVIARAREDFRRGEYRWVAQVMNQVVFADPGSAEARGLAADALEQLGYQAEAGTWRNAYLMGAFELRNGLPRTSGGLSSASPDVVSAIPLEMFFDYLGVRLDAQKAEGRRLIINWHFTDLNRTYTLNLENSALTWRVDLPEPQPDASVRLARSTLDEISTKRTTFPREVVAGRVKIDGNQAALSDLMGMIEEFSPSFPIVTPK